MMNFQKAKKALAELRTDYIGAPQNDPKMWNLSLGLEAAIHELDARLSRIEQMLQVIAQRR